MIDLLYVTHNRLEMTKASFAALKANTNWDLVRALVVVDDESSDGTAEYLLGQQSDWEHGDSTRFLFFDDYVGGPVAAMNHYLKVRPGLHMPRRRVKDDDMFAKVDNDFVMPPGWLDDLLDVMAAAPELDILGTEPMLGLDTEPEVVTEIQMFDRKPGQENGRPVGYTPARHIGGKGLIRVRAFKGRPMTARGRFGFTEWQHHYEDVVKGWVAPDLKSFGLDQLPIEPWISLTERYIAMGWQRAWGKYAHASHAYWTWWTDEHCEHDWLPPHDVLPGRRHKVCAKCSTEVVAS